MDDFYGPRNVEISLRREYSLADRIAVFASFIALIKELRETSDQRLSDRRIGVIMDDVFASKDVEVSLDGDEPKRAAFATLVTPRTISSALHRKLNAGLLDVHLDTLHYIHAFIQVMEKSPPHYLQRR